MLHLMMLSVSLLACDGKTTAVHANAGAPVISRADVSLDKLLQRHYVAQGGYDTLKSIQTLRLEGKSTGPDGDATFTKTLKRPNLLRAEGKTATKTWSKAFDGKQGWVKDGDAPIAEMPAEKLAYMKAMNIDDELVDWKARGHQVELVGLSTVRGAPAYK